MLTILGLSACGLALAAAQEGGGPVAPALTPRGDIVPTVARAYDRAPEEYLST